MKEDGAELLISGGGRSYRTSECWEQNPGVTRGSHSVSERAWRTRCNSAPSDPKQTTLVTSLTATDTSIALDETGEYQFRIDGQNCTASVRRSRTFTLVQRQGEAPVEVAAPGAATSSDSNEQARSPNPVTAPPSAAAASSAKAVARCAVVGEAVRLEVRPARKILRPGERFAFRTLAWDANGCAADTRGAWSVVSADTKVSIAGATITVADDAGDGTVDLAVAFAGKSARVVVEVATSGRYDALLATASQIDAGDNDESAATLVASGNLGTSTAVAQDTARTRKAAFVSIIGALALGLAGLGLFLLRRNGARPSDPGEVKRPGAPSLAVDGVQVGGPRAAARRPVSCPACGAEFPAGSTFCPHDGNRLGPSPLVAFQGPSAVVAGGVCPTCGQAFPAGVKTCPTHGEDSIPAAAFRATAQRSPTLGERGKICPSCGGRYTAPASFCGKDGTALVLVN